MATSDNKPETNSCYLEFVAIPADSEDNFQYDEVTFDDDWSLAEGEEDLDAAVRAVNERAVDTPAGPKQPAPPKSLVSRTPEAVDDFLRNFLLKMGMKNTLDCFQTEWSEMAYKGVLKSDQVGLVPEVYTQNQLLDNELKNTLRERDQYKHTASAAGDTLAKLQKARDFHRLRHMRVVQEKNKVIEDIRKLKLQAGANEPILKQINDKYQAVLKQKMLVSLERDKVLGLAQSLQATLHNTLLHPPGASTSEEPDSDQNKGAMCQAYGAGLTKDTTKTSETSKHLKDSVFPADIPGGLRFVPKDQSGPGQVYKADGFRLNNTLKGHSLPVSCLALHPCKLVVASSSDDKLWRLWGLPEGELIATGEGHTDWLSGISIHPDGAKLATTGGDGSLRIWDLSVGHCVLTLEGHIAATWGCSFHTCGNFVASCSTDNTVKVWDLQSERCRYTLRGHTGSVNSVQFLPTSNTLLTSSADKTLSLWDARIALCAQTLYGHQSSCNHAAFSPTGEAIASCDSRGVVMLWDMRKLAVPTTMLDLGMHPSNQVAFSPLGQMLAVAGDNGSVQVVDLAVSQVAFELKHKDAVQSVVFDHKGEYLLSGASDGQIYMWS
ncbi:sperm-associated antigen 16 protein [Aplochiton taeniatus]